jgi:hypothetical protein
VVYDNADDTNKKIHLFWLGVGTDDFLFGNARDYMEFLDKKGIRSVKEFTHDKYGHTWMNAKYFLDKTLRLLFNKKASEAAMNEGQPAPAATGKEQQFTPSVMARLFPRPIISPEFTDSAIIFRMKAPEAEKVELECEMLPEPLAMQRDSDGVWSIALSDYLYETFKYCFVVDSTMVADPSNMYLSPDNGFKYSIADNPHSPMPAQPTMPVMIRLVPGAGDTVESWFKVGGADAIADRLVADGKTKPCIITTSSMDFMRQGGGMQMPGMKMNVLRADDYPTWSMRRRALVKMLIEIGKQPSPQFPNMQGFGGGGMQGFGGGGGMQGFGAGM